MQRLALLDTGILGMLTYPKKNPHILVWLQRLQQSSFEIRVPEIADYEVRREALRKRFAEAIERLDALKPGGEASVSSGHGGLKDSTGDGR